MGSGQYVLVSPTATALAPLTIRMNGEGAISARVVGLSSVMLFTFPSLAETWDVN